MAGPSARTTCAGVIAAMVLAWCPAALAQSEPAPEAAAPKKLSFFDPEDGKLDMSDFMLNHKGALPVPTIITEPAVGYGAGLGLMFLSESMADAAARAGGRGPAPPNITGVGGAYTENGTWGAGLAHFHTWGGDRYRYLGAVAKVNANLDYYGIQNQPRAYQLQGFFLVQQLLVRVADTRWYIGPRYVYFDSRTNFKFGNAPSWAAWSTTSASARPGW